jgi:hypothetical protein
MAEGKRKYIEDAARVIDGRVAALKEEYERVADTQADITNACDRAAIAEAEHCAQLIRCLSPRPYLGNPYKVAKERWSRGEAL